MNALHKTLFVLIFTVALYSYVGPDMVKAGGQVAGSCESIVAANPILGADPIGNCTSILQFGRPFLKMTGPCQELHELGCLSSGASQHALFIRGDVNADGTIDMTDIMVLQNHLPEGNGLACKDAADVNDDGIIDMADAEALYGFWGFHSPTELPSPHRQLGMDPTPDLLTCDYYNVPA